MKFYAGSQISRAYVELTDTVNSLYDVISSGNIKGENAKLTEFDGLNDVFTTTYAFYVNTEEVFYNQVKMTRGVDYVAVNTTGTILFNFVPDPTLNTPDATPLTFNYQKV